MANADECMLRIIGRFQQQNIVNTMHYRITNQVAGEQAILNSLCLAWQTALKVGWLARHDDDYELIGLKAFRKTGVAKTPGVLAIGEIGSVAGTALPAGLCRTITLYTADAKFRRRGRVMLSACDTTMFEIGDGSVTATEIALLDVLGALLIAQISNAGDEFDPGIPATTLDNWQDFVDSKARETPSMITSRRVREFLIG